MITRIVNFFYAFKSIFSLSSRRIKSGASLKSVVGEAVKFAKVAFSNLSFDTIAIRKVYEGPSFKYGFNDIDRFYRNDSYSRKALDKYTEMIFKSGFVWDGPSDLVNYVKVRINNMVSASGEDFETFLEGIADDLVKYHNCFLYRVRYKDRQVNFGKYKVVGKGINAYYVRIEPSTVIIERDTSGRVIGYSQNIKNGDGYPVFKAEDIIHIYKDKAAGSAFGFPFMVSAIDDIRALRKVEEQVLKLIHRWTHPLYHYVIGDDRLVGQDYEIEDAKKNLEESGTDEMIFTNNRHKINAVGAESAALRVQSYLDYFERRVFTALGVPPQLMNRAASGIASSDIVISFYDTIKAYQKVISDSIKLNIIDVWLKELGQDVVNDLNKSVYMVFNEIDINTQVKKENMLREHWVANMITEDEVRAKLGLKPMKDSDRAKTYNYLIKVPLAKIGVGVMPEPTGNNNSLTKTEISETYIDKDSSSLTKIANSDLKNELMQQLNFHFDRTQKEVIECYKDIKAKEFNFKNIDNSLGIIFKLTYDSMMSESQKYIRHSILKGMGYHNYNEYLMSAYVLDYCFKERAKGILESILGEVKNKVKEQMSIYREDNNVIPNIVGIFESRKYKLRMFADRETKKAYNYGYLLKRHSKGFEVACDEKACSACKSRNGVKIDIEKTKFEDVPPFHSDCDCKIKEITLF